MDFKKDELVLTLFLLVILIIVLYGAIYYGA